MKVVLFVFPLLGVINWISKVFFFYYYYYSKSASSGEDEEKRIILLCKFSILLYVWVFVRINHSLHVCVFFMYVKFCVSVHRLFLLVSVCKHKTQIRKKKRISPHHRPWEASVLPFHQRRPPQLRRRRRWCNWSRPAPSRPCPHSHYRDDRDITWGHPVTDGASSRPNFSPAPARAFSILYSIWLKFFVFFILERSRSLPDLAL